MIIILIVKHGDQESLALFLIPAWQEIEQSPFRADRLIPAQMQREKLFSIAVIAWNLAIMPENERQPMIDQLIKVGLKGNGPLAQQDTREIIDELIARKQKFFAKNERYIVDFQLQDTGKQFHLSVASTLSNPLVKP